MATKLSAFLPDDFHPDEGVAVIAGKDDYPVLVIERLRAAGVKVRLISFIDETREDLVASFPEDERTSSRVGQLGRVLKALAGFGCRSVMMVGQITPRRLFRGLYPDFKTVRLLSKLKERNAETIFGAIATEIEALGLRLLDARAFLDDQMATLGPMTGGRQRIAPDWLAHGVRIARVAAREDIGQAAIVRRGTVLAVEGYDGTNALIDRCAQFRLKDALLVKTAKPGQDWRFDVPVFGERTLERVREAGIRHVALEANSVIILHREAVLQEAARHRIEILGFADE